MDTTSRYHRFSELNPNQQAQARVQFSGYRLDAYRYELGIDERVLCRKPEGDFRRLQ
jgi:hypothetical protein